jgi:EAL domain-containing protein (putative c-di-GMP-specific phosphodiesterase class I)
MDAGDELDLHFLTGTGESERGRIVISYVIQMVRSMGMNLIAEGVENVAQARFLRSRGCCEMQGFYFYKPMPVEEFESLNGKLTQCVEEEAECGEKMRRAGVSKAER